MKKPAEEEKVRTKKENKNGTGKKDERPKFVLGTLVTGFAIYLLFAFIAYIFWWKTDQSLEPSDVISSADIQVKNWSGKSGAWMANLIVSKGFGLASFLFPVMFGGIGLYMLNMRQIKVWSLTVKLAFAIILLSLCFSFIFGMGGGFLGSGPGGAHGYLATRWLNSFIGKVGTGALMIFATVSYLVFALKVSPEAIMSKLPSIGSFKKPAQADGNPIINEVEEPLEKPVIDPPVADDFIITVPARRREHRTLT
jgi:DNA segregation ATPase FtsK/SpoIIIE, S-DNA-T family